MKKIEKEAKNNKSKKDSFYDYIKKNKDDFVVYSFMGLYVCLIPLALLAHKLHTKSLKNASKYGKSQVMKIAKKLNIKNPHKINIKIFKGNKKIYNAASGPFGNIFLTEKTYKKIHTNKAKFIIGHELSHYKHNDALKGLTIQVAIQLGIFKTYSKYKPTKKVVQLLNWARIPCFIQIPLLYITHGIILYKIFPYMRIINDTLVNKTLGKYFEIRADIESASLSRNNADGGIRVFKKIHQKVQSKIAKMSWSKWIRHMLTDPHPSINNRISYLRWFKNWKFGKKAKPSFAKHAAKSSFKWIKKMANKGKKIYT